MKNLIYTFLDLLLDTLSAFFRFMTPKRMIKVAILVLIYYTVVYFMNLSNLSSYRDKAENFVEILKQNDPYKAQLELDSKVQQLISIERLQKIISANEMQKAGEIEWGDWVSKKNYYLLKGTLIFESKKGLPVRFLMLKEKSDKIRFLEIDIGDTNLQAKEKEYLQ